MDPAIPKRRNIRIWQIKHAGQFRDEIRFGGMTAFKGTEDGTGVKAIRDLCTGDVVGSGKGLHPNPRHNDAAKIEEENFGFMGQGGLFCCRFRNWGKCQ